MGLMDKFKNLFTDEEFVDEEEENEEIEIKEIKKEEEEHKLPTFMREKIEREKQEQEKKEFLEKDVKEEIEVKVPKIEEIQNDSQAFEDKSSFKFPIDLSDNDFIETRSRQSIHAKERNVLPPKTRLEPSLKRESIPKKEAKVSELYKDKKSVPPKKEERKFKATPIISPIYGVLDQNYTAGEVEENKGENFEHHRHSKNVDFDSVRKKAYGNLTEEIKENLLCENCEYLKEAKECRKDKKLQSQDNFNNNEDCVYLSQDDEEDYSDENVIKDYNNITLDEATENYYDYGVAYDKKDYVNSSFKDDSTVHYNNEEKEHVKKEIPPVKSSINLLSTLKKSMGDEDDRSPSVTSPKKEEKNLELTDDLFNLIDSMYDERNGSDD
mgnify:FL=1